MPTPAPIPAFAPVLRQDFVLEGYNSYLNVKSLSRMTVASVVAVTLVGSVRGMGGVVKQGFGLLER
jgi:hypothetical protein